jgi:cell division protein FtsL
MTAWSSFYRHATALCLLLAGALVVVLMAVKYQVQQLEHELSGLNTKIATEKQAVHVLQAEFNFLTEPDRLRRLASVHLSLVPIEPRQVQTFELFDRHPGDTHVSAEAPQRLSDGVIPVDATVVD